MTSPKKEARFALAATSGGSGTPEESLPKNDGQTKPAFPNHPLHADFFALIQDDITALRVAALEATVLWDGSVASTSYAIRMKMLAEIVMLKCEKLASALINKAKKS